MNPTEEEAEVNGAVIGELAGLSIRRVQQLAAEGVLPRASRGKFWFMASVRAMLKHYRERAEGHTVERQQFERDKAQTDSLLKKRELDELDGKLYRCDQVHAVWGGVVAEFRKVIEGEKISQAAKNRILAGLREVNVDEYLTGELAEDEG